MQDEVQSAVAEQLGVAALTPPEQEEIVARVSGVLLQAANVAVLTALAADKRESFMALADAGDETGLRAYLAKELPESENIVRAAVAEEVRRFKEYKPV